jgi:predicted restriction endonuclease
MKQYLHELKPLTICRTKLSTKPKTYICLAHDQITHTVYTTERNGFVMTALNNSKSKQVQVDIIYEPTGNPQSLLNYNYPQEFEELRKKAIQWLYNNEKKLRKENRKQALEVISKFDLGEDEIPHNELLKNEKEQNEIIYVFKRKDTTIQEIISDLKNIKSTDPEVINIYSQSYKRDNKTIAQLKILRNFKCQICSTTIQKKDGTFYIEAAHIKPKHLKGCETPDNILLLCPNHHKEFDYGDRNISFHDKDKVHFKLNGIEHKISLKIE